MPNGRDPTLLVTHANTNQDESEAPRISTEEISKRIRELDQKTITDIAIQAAQLHPDVMDMIDNAIHVIQERERNRVIDFDHYAESIWRAINVTHSKKSCARQYDAGLDVAFSTSDIINSIVKQCVASANPQTRLNGLYVLREIGETIVLVPADQLGRQVRIHFQSDTSLTQGMSKILLSMTKSEIRSIKEDDENPEGFWQKLEDLEEEARGYCLHPGLKEVRELVVSLKV